MTDALHPATVGFAERVPLSGFSGAQVTLLRTAGGALFVRKAAWDAPGGGVLRAQARRQAWLAGLLHGAAAVPAVLGEGEADGLYYFDMAFVPSRDAVGFLAQARFDQLGGFADRVEALMALLATLPAEGAHPPERAAILAKLDEITLRTAGNYAAVLDPLRRAVLMLDRLVGDDRATAAHGDLTLENILVGREGDLWLIDPIASPIDHYWIDWSKLFQDVEGGWHAHRGRAITSGVTRWLRNRWFAAACRQSPDYRARHAVLLGLTFARILPYARTDADRAFVAGRVEQFGREALERC